MLEFFTNPASNYAQIMLIEKIEKGKFHDLTHAWGGSELRKGINMKRIF